MSVNSMRSRKKDDEFTVKVSKSPIQGYKCYSVFRDGELFFTIDGDRVSVFEDEVIDNFTLPDYPQQRIFRIADMLFTGLLPLTAENCAQLPTGCKLFSGLK